MSHGFVPHVTLDLDRFPLLTISDDFYIPIYFLNVLQRVILNIYTWDI